MDIESFVQAIITNQITDYRLTDAYDADALVECLKAEADRHWRIDPHISLRFAAAIVSIGQQTGNTSFVALGRMAQGDALKLLDQLDEAWRVLGDAGELYMSVDDEVGWARTRIGRLGICVEVNQVATALQDANVAREIFKRHNETERQLRLEVNMGITLNLLGDYRGALAIYHDGLSLAHALGEAGQSRLSLIYNNMGYSYRWLGNLREASACYENARKLMSARGETRGALLAEVDIAKIAQDQGQYKKALRMLEDIRTKFSQHHPSQVRHALSQLLECYLSLNRYAEARDLAHHVLEQLSVQSIFDRAFTLLQLAAIETALDAPAAAYKALDEAQDIFIALTAEGWLGEVHWRRGQAALKQGDIVIAAAQAALALEYFEANKQQRHKSAAQFLMGQIALQSEQYEEARRYAIEVECAARQQHVPDLEYGAYVLLGASAEGKGQVVRALRHYKSATKVIERVQRSLILHSHADFMEDKQEAVRGLIRLHLQCGNVEEAFASLERAKSQLWMRYISQQDQLRWLTNDPDLRPALEELEQLRQEHHWFYRLAHDAGFSEQQPTSMSTEQAVFEATTRERKLRSLLERLSLSGGADELPETPAVLLDDIQQSVDDSTVMLAYYNDGVSMWVFCLTARSFELVNLGQIAAQVDQLINKLQANIDRTLRVEHSSVEASVLNGYLNRILQQLYELLVAPIPFNATQRLLIVPYGSLHYLPFHLLRRADGYWLEQHEIVILPAASLATRPPPKRARGARAFAHSWDGRLKNAGEEAEQVVRQMGGHIYRESDAARACLELAPKQVLHIAAHSKHRMDHPDFSFIELADGPVYFDDLLQHDLSYELVTLSACETGRVRVSSGDELIGLGRGFLFSGAGALVASLWRVDDTLTLELMDSLYRNLNNGDSKAAALREAQLAHLREHPVLHPAFWGGFELIGNPDPLSNVPTS